MSAPVVVQLSGRDTNVAVLHRWIAGRISEILGNEDDVVTELCFNLIEGSRYVSRGAGSTTWAFLLTVYSSTARYQVSANSTHRVSRQRHGFFLQRALEAIPQCSDQLPGCSEGTARSEEAGAHTGKGMVDGG